MSAVLSLLSIIPTLNTPMPPITPSDSENYALCLLPKGHGFPLWVPKPNDSLPDEYRDQGVNIGDVGIVTSDGAFDYLFNICQPADHPINLGRTPPDFQHVKLDAPKDVFTDLKKHPTGSYVGSLSIEKKGLEGDFSSLENSTIPAGIGASISFTSSRSNFGLLCLPDGADRFDLINLNKFYDIAIQNGMSWYEHANGQDGFGRMAGNGSLYLVTGCDKSLSWGVASHSSTSEDISLKFTACSIGGGSASVAYSWDRRGPATVRVSDQRNGDGLISNRNQCPFIRGFKISVRESAMSKRRSTVKLSTIDGNNAKKFIPKTKDSYTPGGGRTPSFFGRSGGNSGGLGKRHSNISAGHQESDSLDYYSSDEEDSDSDMIWERRKPYHPSDVINDWLLDITPNSVVAVTHDNVWLSLLDQKNSKLPSNEELIRHAACKYIQTRRRDGVVLIAKDVKHNILQESEVDDKRDWLTQPVTDNDRAASIYQARYKTAAQDHNATSLESKHNTHQQQQRSNRMPEEHDTSIGRSHPSFTAYDRRPSPSPHPSDVVESPKLPMLKTCPPSRPPRKKALLVGISLEERDDDLEASLPNLSGPHHDVAEMEKFLLTRGYAKDDIVVMVYGSEHKALVPTRNNLVRAMKHLVCDAQAGDHLFFHYSGHIDELPNTTGAEPTGKDRVLKTSDSKTIRDNDLRKFLVKPLPEGAFLTAIFDTCHSATLLDLPHHNCNKVWVPWISKAQRQATSRWTSQARQNALADIHLPSGDAGRHGNTPGQYVGKRHQDLKTRRPLFGFPSRRPRSLSSQNKPMSTKFGFEISRSAVPMAPVGQHLEGSCDMTKKLDCPSGPLQSRRKVSSLPPGSPLSFEVSLETKTDTFIGPVSEHDRRSPSPEPWLGIPIEKSASFALSSNALDAFASGGRSRASSSDTWAVVDSNNSSTASQTADPLISSVDTTDERYQKSSRGGWQSVFGTASTPIPRSLSPAPYSAFECDGWCRQRMPGFSALGPCVVSISACKDSQSVWEDPNGKSMTLSLLDFLKAHPDATLYDIMTDISHKFHKHVMKLHEAARAVRKAISESASSSSSKCTTSEDTNAELEMHNFQDPQLASLLPLDMNAPFLI